MPTRDGSLKDKDKEWRDEAAEEYHIPKSTESLDSQYACSSYLTVSVLETSVRPPILVETLGQWHRTWEILWLDS